MDGKQDLESCACTEEDGLAMMLELEISHPLGMSAVELRRHYLHIFNTKDESIRSSSSSLS